jgi:hypothetical protein
MFRPASTPLVRFVILLIACAISSVVGGFTVRAQVHARQIAEHGGVLPNAYLIVRRDECEGAFDFLEIFERPEIKRRVSLDGLYVVGTPRDSAAVARIARARDVHAAVRRATSSTLLQRNALGYRRAVLVVTNRTEQVVLARAIPSTPTEYLDLARLLESFSL